MLRHVQSLSLRGDCQDDDSDDETDIGLMRPKALDLVENDFSSGFEYVRAFVKETRVLHRGDALNDVRRAASLGHVYHTENLQPSCLRTELTADSLYLTAVVPVVKEIYSSEFTAKKPKYTLLQSEQISETNIYGILTP